MRITTSSGRSDATGNTSLDLAPQLTIMEQVADDADDLERFVVRRRDQPFAKWLFSSGN